MFRLFRDLKSDVSAASGGLLLVVSYLFFARSRQFDHE